MTSTSDRLRALQEALAEEIEERRVAFGYAVEQGRVRFEAEVLARHRALKVRLRTLLRHPRPLFILTAPVIYGMLVPLMLLDLALALYQGLCFPVYGIKRVRRGDHVFLDRHQLAYLNGLEKLNCAYCGYANGLFAYAREIGARTEQFWCPIKHSRRVPEPHGRYPEFADFGDAEGFRARQALLRKALSGKGA